MTETTVVRSSATTCSATAKEHSFLANGKPFIAQELSALEQILLDQNDLAGLVALHLGVEGAVRSRELCHIRLEGVDIAHHRLLIQNDKGNRRFAFFSAKSAESLAKWIEARNSSCGHPTLLHDQHGRPFTSQTLTGRLTMVAHKAGVVGFRFGRLRATMVTKLLGSGMDPLTIADIGGWKTVGSLHAHISSSSALARSAYDEAMADQTE